MEHCQHSLRHLLDTIPSFSDSHICEILRDVLTGLKSLHSRNIVHLDIKPENILYSKSHKYKIADLGLSRIAIRRLGEDIIEGDSRYLAPELLNDANIGFMPDLTKADIFSLGATFYELVTMRNLPNNGEEWHEIRNGRLNGLDKDKGHSDSLKDLIKKMMDPCAERRPSAGELLDSRFLMKEKWMEIGWEKIENRMLRKKIGELEEKLRIKRKKSC